MKIYKITLREGEGDANTGFKYVANKAQANTLQNQQNKVSGVIDEVEEIEFEPTKKDILALLNSYFSYPDNG